MSGPVPAVDSCGRLTLNSFRHFVGIGTDGLVLCHHDKDQTPAELGASGLRLILVVPMSSQASFYRKRAMSLLSREDPGFTLGQKGTSENVSGNQNRHQGGPLFCAVLHHAHFSTTDTPPPLLPLQKAPPVDCRAFAYSAFVSATKVPIHPGSVFAESTSHAGISIASMASISKVEG